MQSAKVSVRPESIHFFERKRTMKSSLYACSFIILTCTLTTTAAETGGEQLAGMVRNGKVSMDLRYRYEVVDEDDFDDKAEASTFRTRLTLETAPLNGITALVEMDDSRTLGPDDYNSTENGKTEYPVVADPEGTDLNQLWLRYNSDFDTTLGRQRILHGNQRFIGGVAFRQNEQTFDALRAVLNQWDNWVIDLSYVDQVNRIFGPNDGANPAELDGDNFFLRADYQLGKEHRLSGFAYLFDFDDQSAFGSGKTVDNSSDTWGIEYRANLETLIIDLAWATQTDAGDSTLDYDADYYKIEAAVAVASIKLNAGLEVLGADNGVGFATPLATGHKFQGWADKFLSTPGDGIEDFYIGINGKAGSVNLGAIYHDFKAEDSSDDFGTEIDLVAAWPVDKHITLKAEYASFDSDDDSRFSDTDKFWLTLQAKLE
jgi:hypothetical protein